MPVRPIEWVDGRLRLIDQTRLPDVCDYVEVDTIEAVWSAIRRMQVRGAPAIGMTAAFGLYFGIRDSNATIWSDFLDEVAKNVRYLLTARPTAVNLAWALKRIQGRLVSASHTTLSGDIDALKALVLEEALALIEEDNEVCRAIGEHGAEVIGDGEGVLTYCNAGGLGTAGWGTALAAMYVAKEKGRGFHVFACETRPVMQGARLTTWELKRAGIPVTLVCDNMAAPLMRDGRVDVIIVGTDRVAANGDVANKIGTYMLAALAHLHGIPFYVAAPTSSIDMAIKTGEEIPIELRPPEEITRMGDTILAPGGIDVYNPAFDVTPAKYVSGLITEHGILAPPFDQGLERLMK